MARKKYSFRRGPRVKNAKPTVVDGKRFDSKKEADYYRQLLLAQKAGVVHWFHRQVSIELLDGITYRVDFLVFYTDGTMAYIDVKGYETEIFKLKKKMVEKLYPFEIEVVK